MINATSSARRAFVRAIPFLAALAAVIGFAHLIFRDFLPGPLGIGPDYSYFFPHLLANYYAIRAEGWLSIPWFTPAFCGGIPNFADPQSIFYSVPQLLVSYLQPVRALHVTLLIFIGAGFAGTYFFLRLSLGCSQAASIVGASIFALNGFFSHRILIGHLAFHGIMLTPWLALALTMPGGRSSGEVGKSVVLGAGGGAVVGYWLLSGMAVLVIPAFLAVTALILIHGLNGGSLRSVPVRAALAIALGLGLAASKITGILAYTAELPRTGYLLPGMSDLAGTVGIAFRSLFLSPENIAANAASGLSNVQWQLDRHEFEFGVTLVPLALIGIALVANLVRRRADTPQPKLDRNWQLGLGTALLMLLALPIAVNTFAPAWNEFLKSLPVIGSASTLFRWFFIFIPVLAVASAIALDRAFLERRIRIAVGAASFAAILLSHAWIDRTYYASMSYDPKTVSAAFANARKLDAAPTIRHIGANVNSKGQIMSRGSNDLIVLGVSQLRCYNPMFGYLLESFPMGSLHPGSALEISDGHLNLKNPACYVFPKENGCKPGEHFSDAEKEAAERLLGYRSYPFERSHRQKIADLISWLSLLAWPLVILVGLIALRRGVKRMEQSA